MKTATQNFSRAKFQAVQGNYRRTDLDTCLNKLLTKNIEFAVLSEQIRVYLMQKSCYNQRSIMYGLVFALSIGFEALKCTHVFQTYNTQLQAHC